MKNLLASIVVMLVLMPATVMAAPLLSGSPGQVLGRYIVVLNPGQEPAAVAKTHAAVPEHLYRHALRGFSAALSDAALQRLLADRRVAYIEPDTRIWALRDIAVPSRNSRAGSVSVSQPQAVPWGVTRVGGPFDGTGKTAWVIDSGIDMQHADLHVDASRSVSFVRAPSTPQDGDGHGTHVAGTIGAINNDRDVVGVAAGATLVAVRVLGDAGGGFGSWLVAGIDYVAAHAAPGDVANISLGGYRSPAVETALLAAANKGILFAIAAGNERTDANSSSPGRVEHQNVYTVSAINSNDRFAWFSNYGNPPVDVAAPGVNILSTALGGGTTTMGGTSMAAPHVAGLLLLGLPLETNGTASKDPDGIPDPIAYHY